MPPSVIDPTTLILLKTRSQPEDPYEDVIASRGYNSVFLAVLEHQQINLDRLRDAIVSGNTDRDRVGYDGLIITSQRAVEALGTLLSHLSGILTKLRESWANC